MQRLEAYIYNSMMEMAEAKQQKVIEIRFAAALEMINGYNSYGNDAVDPVQLKDWSTFGTDRVSFIFGKTTISFSKRGGGEGKEYFLDENIRTGIWVFAVYNGDISKYEETDWIQSVYTSKGIDGKPSNKWFNDYSKSLDSNEPFYYNTSAFTIEWRNKIDAKFGGRVFMDGPSRMSYYGATYSWSAILSLVGLKNGTWETIQTINYGFSAKSGHIIYNPMILRNHFNTFSNFFHESLIRNLNRI
ncbi:MAG TPA: hypothetical protein VLZ83_11410 [Edaphocola sp.]|nr:hypothetical protein [Edaphocola sp.]